MWAVHMTHTVLGFEFHRYVATRGQTVMRNKSPHCLLLSGVSFMNQAARAYASFLG